MANFAFRKDPFGSCVGCRLEGGKAKGNGKGGSDGQAEAVVANMEGTWSGFH